jgi:thymidylate synthase
VPFNIAAYSLITKIIARQTDFKPGTFSHTQVDSHIYCGKGDRGEWYSDNLEELKRRVRAASGSEDYLEIRDWVLESAPEEEEAEPSEDRYGYDHVPGLLKQLSRTPKERPTMKVADRSIDDLEYGDFQLSGYNPDEGLKFSVAE